jgi:tRNA (cytidine/uridine-2'-O-)-methyltransferase
MLNLVLVEPEIPQNIGNVARTCAVTGCRLHLVGPLGFKNDDKKLKRAGLDYWHLLDIVYYDSLDQYLEMNKPAVKRFATTHGGICYTDITYPDSCHILFGRESAGLPHSLINENMDCAIRIPQRGGTRSLNLSNAVAVIVYEALRQQGFDGLEIRGERPL